MQLKAVLLVMIIMFPLSAQGVVEREVDPLEARLEYYTHAQGFLDTADVPVALETVADLRIVSAAYEQFAYALEQAEKSMLTSGIDSQGQLLDQIRHHIDLWTQFWSRVTIVPQTLEITTQRVTSFYSTVLAIDSQITETIHRVNELIDGERLLTSIEFPL